MDKITIDLSGNGKDDSLLNAFAKSLQSDEAASILKLGLNKDQQTVFEKYKELFDLGKIISYEVSFPQKSKWTLKELIDTLDKFDDKLSKCSLLDKESDDKTIWRKPFQFFIFSRRNNIDYESSLRSFAKNVARSCIMNLT